MIDISGWRSTSLWIAIIAVVVNLVLAFGIIRGDPQKFGLQPYGRSERLPGAGRGALGPQNAPTSRPAPGI